MCIRMGVDEHNFVFDRFSGQNKILSPLYNSNRGIVTIIMWCQNWILTRPKLACTINSLLLICLTKYVNEIA